MEARRRSARWCAALAGGIAAALLSTGTAGAATFEVTRTGDPPPGPCTPSDCSLREAVIAANATAANDRILLRPRSYALVQAGEDDDAAAGDLDVTPGSGRLLIVGEGRGRTEVDARGVDRVLDVLDGAAAALRRVTLRGGTAVGPGGLARNLGRLTIAEAALRGGEGTAGGAIYNGGDASLAVVRTLIAGNTGSESGGALQNEGLASATFERTTMSGNRTVDGPGGGAIYNQDDGSVVINRSTLQANEVLEGFGGGAIFNRANATLAIKRSTIDRNRMIDGFGGGGVFTQNEARARIVDSTISRNRAPSDPGGGIYAQNDTVLRLVNSTVSGNLSGNEGGGIYTNSTPRVHIVFSTIARNRAAVAGGGIFDNTAPPGPPGPPYVTFRGSLVARNLAAGSPANCFVDDPANFESDGGNVDDANSCGFDRNSDRRNRNPGIRKLARNGGPTMTHALKLASGAFNAAPRQGCPRRDQRGVPRPQGRRCDAGAFELRRPR